MGISPPPLLQTPPMSVSQGPPGTVETCVYSAQMGLAGCVPGELQHSHFGHVLWPLSPESFQLPFHPIGPHQDPKAPCSLPLLFGSMWLAHVCSQMVAGLSEPHPFLLREAQLSGAKQFPPSGAWARVTKCSGLSLCWSQPVAHPSLSSLIKEVCISMQMSCWLLSVVERWALGSKIAVAYFKYENNPIWKINEF